MVDGKSTSEKVFESSNYGSRFNILIHKNPENDSGKIIALEENPDKSAPLGSQLNPRGK